MGTSWKMPSRPSCSTLMRSQRLLTSAGVSATASAKMCGCRRMSLSSMSWATLARSPAPSSPSMRASSTTCSSRSPSSPCSAREVAVGDGVGQLVDLLDGVADDVLRRLLAVPGALHAEHVDDALERDQLLAEQRVVEGVARRDGAKSSAGPRRSRRSAAPEAARRRSSRASCGPPSPTSATTTSPSAARRDERRRGPRRRPGRARAAGRRRGRRPPRRAPGARRRGPSERRRRRRRRGPAAKLRAPVRRRRRYTRA